MNAILVASSDNAYVRAILQGLLTNGLAVAKVLLGSRSENRLFTLNSLRRIRSRLGWVEVARRLQERHADIYTGAANEDLRTLAARARIPIVNYDFVNGGSVLAELAEVPDAVVVLSGCGLVDSAFIAAARGRCVNGHPALLPGLRGVDVVDWALHDGLPVGVSAHLVEPSVDAGHILVTQDVPIVPGQSYIEFRRRVLEEQAAAVVTAVRRLADGDARPRLHDLSRSRMCFAAPSAVRRAALARYCKAAQLGDLDSGG